MIYLTTENEKYIIKKDIVGNTAQSRLIALCGVVFTEPKSGTEILYRFSCSKL